MLPKGEVQRGQIAWCLVLIMAVFGFGAPADLFAEPGQPSVLAKEIKKLTVEGIAASIGEDDPRVLYILPWQSPSLPRRPRADLGQAAPDLAKPNNPMTLEHHRVFRETLDPLSLNPRGN